FHRFEACDQLGFAPDGKVVAGWGGCGSAVRLWDVATGEPVLRDEQTYRSVDAVAFTWDGRSLVTTAWMESASRLGGAATVRQRAGGAPVGNPPRGGRGNGFDARRPHPGARL